jgi:chromosomal replication initiation ATPase DnaA
MAAIAERVAAEHDLTLSDLRRGGRERVYSWPRQVAMAAMRDAGYSLSQIGRFMSGRDHSTVSYGVKRARERAAS